MRQDKLLFIIKYVFISFKFVFPYTVLRLRHITHSVIVFLFMLLHILLVNSKITKLGHIIAFQLNDLIHALK